MALETGTVRLVACRRFGILCLATFTGCGPRRPADVMGIVTGIGQGAYGWQAMVEAKGDARYPDGEPTVVYLGERPTHRLRAGCRVRVWFSEGMVMTSYPGQAFAEALRIDSCPANGTQPSRPAA
jgi:hypothetical protein